MRKVVKKIVIMTMAAAPMVAVAQDKVEASVGADVVIGYVWRGQDLGHAAVQPYPSSRQPPILMPQVILWTALQRPTSR